MSSVERSAPLRAAHLVKCLGAGGTERQLVVLLSALEPTRVRSSLACLIKTGEYLQPLAKLGIDPPEFGLDNSLLRARTLVQATRLAAWLRTERAEVLHCHDYYSNVVGALAAPLAGVPWIVSRRDLGAWRRPAQAKLLSLVSRRAPMVLCNAQAVRDAVLAEGVQPERVRVVPNGLDLAVFDAERARPIDPPLAGLEGGPVVALVANMKHALKGHLDFLDAATRVRRTVPDARFLLVGDGELRPELERAARTLGLGDAALFPGERADVPALLSRCAAAVSASTSEGLSNAVMEAMAAALPVVATRVGGAAELVVEGRTGFLVRPRAPEELAARLTELLTDPNRARELGEAGRRRLEAEFQASVLAERCEGLYAELVGRAVEDAVAA